MKDRSILIHLVQSPQWTALLNVANEITKQLHDQPNNGTTVEEIAIHSIRIDAQVAGVRRLLQEVINITNVKE